LKGKVHGSIRGSKPKGYQRFPKLGDTAHWEAQSDFYKNSLVQVVGQETKPF
jgi:hypothetical protein